MQKGRGIEGERKIRVLGEGREQGARRQQTNRVGGKAAGQGDGGGRSEDGVKSVRRESGRSRVRGCPGSPKGQRSGRDRKEVRGSCGPRSLWRDPGISPQSKGRERGAFQSRRLAVPPRPQLQLTAPSDGYFGQDLLGFSLGFICFAPYLLVALARH